MNPNLKFGQVLSEMVEGCPAGLTRSLKDLVRHINLLAGSKIWKINDRLGMAAWTGDSRQ